ncbi:hypothetical protein GCM10023219_23070 [Stakelama sediminis]|uniref:Thiamine-phosphate pyrophosphorylase n=1 Tax=Stakelama sediminis TaxID=463200 RepID=A0A840Z0M5_9SPHN|nr:thiamine phosphate synthase [Stakelama sediminis]MBB5719262.1 thiamine-phosphate pyrophosphorylase [Stakelama sediminis]
MQPRHPRTLPRHWLMTDERMGDRLWDALDALPRGAGVVFRHYSLPLAKRRALFAQVAKLARRKHLLLLRAGAAPLGRGEAGTHNARCSCRGGVTSRAVHDMRELAAANHAGVDLIFLSPAFSTRSHKGAGTLGPLRFAQIAAQSRAPVIALGGMTPMRARRLRAANLHGWAAIDWWLEKPGRC